MHNARSAFFGAVHQNSMSIPTASGLLDSPREEIWLRTIPPHFLLAPDASLMIYPWKLVEDDMKTLAFNVTKDHPPAILVSAEDDPTAPIQNPIMYYLALKTTKAPPSELHTYPRGGHGFGLCTITNVTAWHAECTWPDRAALFLHDLWNMSTTAQQ
mmetsp:Transcript_35740/g.83015  ORF Transcript_35740/g.83015 Transcript_35740/m.83015 type:complete len:157 (+) Transcript_35740:1098-1568(+)